MGYEVISTEVLAGATKEDSLSRLQALRELGTELLISGAVVSGMDHDMKMGLFLGSAKSHMKSVVDRASLRILADVTNNHHRWQPACTMLLLKIGSSCSVIRAKLMTPADQSER